MPRTWAKEIAVYDWTRILNSMDAMNTTDKGVAFSVVKYAGRASGTVCIMNRDTGASEEIEISLISLSMMTDEVYIGSAHGDYSQPGFVFENDFNWWRPSRN